MAELRQFSRVVTEIRRRFPWLTFAAGPVEHLYLQAEASIPAQPGLDFPVSFNLQDDELHLNIGAFWCSWFPCRHDDVTDQFIDAVDGVISGRYRITEFRIAGRLVSTHLQRPTGKGGWCAIAIKQESLLSFLPWPRDRVIMQNRGIPPENG